MYSYIYTFRQKISTIYVVIFNVEINVIGNKQDSCYIFIYVHVYIKDYMQVVRVQKINNNSNMQNIRVKDILLPILGPGGQAQFKVKI